MRSALTVIVVLLVGIGAMGCGGDDAPPEEASPLLRADAEDAISTYVGQRVTCVEVESRGGEVVWTCEGSGDVECWNYSTRVRAERNDAYGAGKVERDDAPTRCAEKETADEAPLPAETDEAGGASVCARAGDIVEDYNTLVPGASRAEYLTLLHKLQRDCPSEAEARGLTGDFLPQCARLDQESCTMYEG